MHFMSDGRAYAHRQIVEGLGGYRPIFTDVFEGDPETASVQAQVSKVFDKQADVFVVATGTASNGLALAALCEPHGAILCHWDAHIQTDECGGPILFTGGASLNPLRGAHGKVDLDALKTALANSRFGIAHRVQPQVLSLTQATEAGTIYRPEALLELAGVARHYGLRIHMDGARFANAVAALECHPADISWRSGIDILSLGATKNGAIAAEAIVVFDRELSRKLRFIQKRTGHFIAKSSLIARQLRAYFDDDLWLRNAKLANAQARLLASALQSVEQVQLVNPVETNQVFVTMPQSLLNHLRSCSVSFDIDWRTHPVRHHRFSASFATQSSEIDQLREVLKAWKSSAGE